MRHALALFAALLFALPALALFALPSRRARELWERALVLPVAYALDLFLVLGLCAFMRLDQAAWASRGVWAAVLVAGLVLRRRRAEGGGEGGTRSGLAPALASAAVAAALSLLLSRACHNADRPWHIPLVGSLRGQSLPFRNVYEPGRELAYHYAGDVVAACLQAFSFGSLHASHALSLAHDVLFAVTGASLGLFFAWAGLRGALSASLASAAVLLAGPITILRPEVSEGGYSFINFLRLSFRPHTPLAGLWIVGLAIAVLPRLLGRAGAGAPWRGPAPAMIALVAALSITDEASVGVFGLALGATWLAFPGVLPGGRKRGALLLLGLLAAVLLPGLAFGASFGAEGAGHEVKLVPWRSPGYHNPPVAFSKPGGLKLFAYDALAIGTIALAGLLRALRPGAAALRPSAFFLAALAGLSALGLGRVEVDGLPVESHRFATAVMLLAPLFGLSWIAGEPSRPPGAPRLRPATAAVALVLGASAASTILWARGMYQLRCFKPATFLTTEPFFETDCRKVARKPLFARAQPAYVERSIYYLVAGCRPLFTPGPPAGRHWKLKIGFPTFGPRAIAELDAEMLPEGERLPLFCPKRPSADRACAFAEKAGRCGPYAERTRLCVLEPEERARLLGR